MIACYREFCKDLGIFREPKPSIAILNWRNVKVIPEYEIWRDFFISNGHESAIVDPRDLHVKGGTLFGSPINDPGRSFAIDLIYRRLVTYEITRELVQGDLAPFIDACREGLACIVNPFKSNLITSKGVLALLSDASNASLFTRKEGKYIEKFVPWSRLLEKGETWYREREIELIPFLQAQPDRFVIKAARSRGGREVILGNDPRVGREEWSQLIERHAREGGWIVQERVQIPELTLPVVRNRDITLETFKINLNPYVIGSKFCNAGCRASKSNIINVGVGGGQLPTFLVMQRAPESPE
ncbi:hypothetical protein GF325_10785 [Candidatus Bathyarchaeota archaeon]|nr:hypothetical protein [Candidatus Bathyarchaeota archaeon]